MTEKWREDEEYLSYVEDLLATEEVQKLAEYTQHMHSTRLEHSISVSYHSYKLAKRWNGNARATARAGLLHDLKLTSPKDSPVVSLARIEQIGIT